MILRLKNITKKYSNFELSCTMDLEEGRVTGLIGANGTGKTTTFKGILDLIHLDGGKVELFDTPHKQLSREQKEKIGVVLNERTFSGYLTLKQISSIMEKTYKKFKKNWFLEQCLYYQLPLNKKIKDYSTGMRAKMKLLLALSYDPQLLILDEPTEGLDIVARDELLNLLRTYMEEENRSILISSHVSSDLENFCDDVYFIHDGTIIYHEEMPVLLDEYGIVKVKEEEYKKLDETFLLYKKREPFGYSCLTTNKQFYQENYPEIIVDRGSIDEMLLMIVKGEKLC